MTRLISLHRELYSMLKHNQDGSFGTQAARRSILMQAATQLFKLGYENIAAKNLKLKHVQALLNYWQEAGLSAATIKNRLSHLRWWSEKIGKINLIPQTNQELGVENRCYVDNDRNRAHGLTASQLKWIKSERMELSLLLQQHFGLRREESLKFQPSYADQGDRLVLKDSWCKGGRARWIPIRTSEQHEILQRCHQLIGKGSMVPDKKSYIQHVKAFENACHRAGISNVHGLRHHYAQQRYRELTGWDCAKLPGGLERKAMTVEQWRKDRAVRLIISAELGHGRGDVVAIYIG